MEANQRLDAFTKEPSSQSSLAFEKASILFNLASVISLHARKEQKLEDNVHKSAFHSMQAAAGILKYIDESFLHAPSKDLNRTTISALVNLMLAQAQVIVIKQREGKDSRPALSAKLVMQAASLYQQSLEFMQKAPSKVFEPSITCIVIINATYLTSLAQTYQACADKQKSSYGQAVLRLQLAERYGLEATSLCSQLKAPSEMSYMDFEVIKQPLKDQLRRNVDNIRHTMVQTTKENDCIFHQLVPSEGALEAISKLSIANAKSMAEIAEMNDMYSRDIEDIFSVLVPSDIAKTVSIHSKKKEAFIRDLEGLVSFADQEIDMILKKYGICPREEDLSDDGSIGLHGRDDCLLQQCAELAGLSTIVSSIATINRQKEQIRGVGALALRSLEQERLAYDRMLFKYGKEWALPSYSDQSLSLFRRIQKHLQEMAEADRDDCSTIDMYQKHHEAMDLMWQTYESRNLSQLRANFAIDFASPSLEASVIYENAPLIDVGDSKAEIDENQALVLGKLRNDLLLLRSDRAQVMTDLMKMLSSNNLSTQLLYKKRDRAMVQNDPIGQEVEKLNASRTKIAQSTHRQKDICEKILHTHESLTEASRLEQQLKDREVQDDVLLKRRCDAVLNKYYHVRESINNSKAFYHESIKALEDLQKMVNDHVANRRMEGLEMLQNLDLQGDSLTNSRK